jgi:quercetin dioxygenase-like cupin family protein
MKRGNVIGGVLAGVALAAAFQAGVVVGETSAPQEARGVAVGTTSTLDLAPELESLDGRQLRVRLITFQPGGAVPLHSHRGRPGIATVLKGTLTEHVEGKGVFERAEGDRLVEDRNTVHWAENRTDEPVTVLAADVYRP